MKNIQHGYKYTKNIYAEFVQKIDNGQLGHETDLDNFFDLLDQGLLIEVDREPEHDAVYYAPGTMGKRDIRKLQADCKRRLSRLQSFVDGLKPGQFRLEDAAERRMLTRRIQMQEQTLNYLSR